MPEDGAPLIGLGCLLTFLLAIGLVWASFAELPLHALPPILYSTFGGIAAWIWAHPGYSAIIALVLLGSLAGNSQSR